MNYRLIIFDADGTLRYCTVAGQPCPNRAGEWKLYPGVVERLAQFNWTHPGDETGVGYGIASNQGGVGVGYFSEETALSLLVDTFREAFGFSPADRTIEICPHVPHSGCGCRKPDPTMLKRLMELYGTTSNQTLFVGDRDDDRKAAENAECDFQLADEFFSRDQAQ